jgi:hypothetical protein
MQLSHIKEHCWYPARAICQILRLLARDLLVLYPLLGLVLAPGRILLTVVE